MVHNRARGRASRIQVRAHDVLGYAIGMLAETGFVVSLIVLCGVVLVMVLLAGG
jgi:hypothetical protein